MHSAPFHFDFDVEVFEKASAEAGKERRIGGFVSTDHLDRQGEVLIQEGLDFDPFLTKGWFNDNHSPDTDGVIGYPEFAELRTMPGGMHKGWYVEGYLLKPDRANGIWDLATELQKHDRKLGFSVEGGILKRDDENAKQVRKAVVREVAITKCPVNTATALNVLAKSLSAGSAISAPAVAPGEGFPLRTESLEGLSEEEKKKRKKRLTKSEAITLLMRAQPKLAREYAERIIDYALRWHPAT
jgi:hypothetical protein